MSEPQLTTQWIVGLIFGGGGILLLVFAFLRGDIVTKGVHDRYVAMQERTIGKLSGDIVTKLSEVAEAQTKAVSSLAQIAGGHTATTAGMADILEQQRQANEGLAETLSGIGTLIMRHDKRLAAHSREVTTSMRTLNRIDRKVSRGSR